MLNMESLTKLARTYRGLVRSVSSQGLIDIEFPTVHRAAVFAEVMLVEDMCGPPAVLLECDLRAGDVVTSLHQAVVLTVHMNDENYNAYWERLNT